MCLRRTLRGEFDPFRIEQAGEGGADVALLALGQDDQTIVATAVFADVEWSDGAASDLPAVAEGEGELQFAGRVCPAGVFLQVRAAGDEVPLLLETFPEDGRVDPGDLREGHVDVLMLGLDPDTQGLAGGSGDRARESGTVTEGDYAGEGGLLLRLDQRAGSSGGLGDGGGGGVGEEEVEGVVGAGGSGGQEDCEEECRADRSPAASGWVACAEDA